MVKYNESERCAHLIGAVLVCAIAVVGGKYVKTERSSIACYFHKEQQQRVRWSRKAMDPVIFRWPPRKREKERSRKIPKSIPMKALHVEAN